MVSGEEVSLGTKVSLLIFVLVLVGTLGYLVFRQNADLAQIYAASDGENAGIKNTPSSIKVDTARPAP